MGVHVGTHMLARLAAEATATQLYRDVDSKLPLAKTGKRSVLFWRGSLLPSAAGGIWRLRVFIHCV